MNEPHPNRKERKMRLTRLRLLLPALLLVAIVGVLSSCGGSSNEGSTGGTGSSGIPSEFAAPTSAPDNAQKGGDLTVLNEGDIDYMDPGAAYYQVTYEL